MYEKMNEEVVTFRR